MAEDCIDGGMETIDLAPEREERRIGPAVAEGHLKVEVGRRAHDDTQASRSWGSSRE